MIDAGTMTERFELLKPTRTQNDFGEVTNTYTRQTFRWGAMRAVRGRERLNAAQVSTEVTHEVFMRKAGVDIKPDWRLKLKDGETTRTFEVVEVFDPDNSGRQWTMEVAEVVTV